MGIGGNRSAFAFSGKAGIAMGSVGSQAAARANVVLSVVDAGLSLVSAGASILKYAAARQQTAEVRAQAAAKKWQLDAAVDGLRERAELQIAHRTQQMLERVSHQEQRLERLLDKLRRQVEAAGKQQAMADEAWIKQMDLEAEVRRPVKAALELYDELLDWARQNREPFETIADLQEKHRLCAEKYELLIKRIFHNEVKTDE